MHVLTGRCLIDTNVLIYATLRGDRRFEIAQKVLEAARHGEFEAFIAVQNLAEMYPNLTGSKQKPPDSPELARRKIRSIAALRFLQVLPITIAVVEKALELYELQNMKRQDYFDVQLAALMMLESIPTIITENSADFSSLQGIRAVNPFLTH